MIDLTSPETVRNIAKKYNFVFKKDYGQNFLLDRSVVELAAEAADVRDGAIEIGPGFGVLTRELAKRSEKVISFEIDEKLMPVLDYTLSDFDNVKIINQDITKADLENIIKSEFGTKRVSLAANLPYYITTPIITHILESRIPLKNMVVMVQKEVAERICAEVGSKKCGAITVLCRYYSEPEIIATVPSGSFMPEPEVDSALVKLAIREKPCIEVEDEEMFFRTVKAAFQFRRKTLENCLSQYFNVEKVRITKLLETCNIPANIRGERLSIEEFALLSNKMSEIEKQQNNTSSNNSSTLDFEDFSAWSKTHIDENGNIILSLADKLKYFRIDKGFSRKQIAEIANVSVSYVTRLENKSLDSTSKSHCKIIAQINEALDKFLKSHPEDKTDLLRKMFISESNGNS